MTDPLVIVGADGHAYVSVAEHERQRSKKEIFKRCLVDIAHRMNQMADEIEQLQAEPWTDATAPAPLGD
ncbi:MAG: hypothetical protein RLZZ524_3119 [Pseudomonadota bacterium]|jgi:hypothetical protein